MAAPFDEPIIEGFICPNCLKSFRTDEVLRIHFEEEHKSNPAACTRSDGLAFDLHYRLDESPGRTFKSFAFYDQLHLTEQPACNSNSLTLEFRRLRRARVNRDALETNSLLIRLEKLVNSPPMSKLERRVFEQSVIPWIDASVVLLCPSCGKNFGLGVEEAYPLDEESPKTKPSTQSSSNLVSFMAERSKHTITRITNAILDYNPIYRRRHHCRLCGHVLCADCSLFLSRKGALQILGAINAHQLGDFESFVRSSTDESVENAQKKLPLNSCSEELFLPPSKCPDSLLDLKGGDTTVHYLRVCGVCKDLLQRKLDRVLFHQSSSPISSLHAELRKHMQKVNESLPLYSAVAESLHSGEQRYALDVAQTMRHDLLESLQQIDAIRHRFDDMASAKPPETTPNFATIRLLRTLSKMSCQFLQTNLPPLRALPTLHQYGSLTAQRQNELEARWAEEERALAQLEMRVAQAAKPTASSTATAKKPTTDDDELIIKMSQLAASIDNVSGRLLRARSAGDENQVQRLLRQLEKLETDFQRMSSLIQQT